MPKKKKKSKKKKSKKIKIAVLCEESKIEESKKSGAEVVGSDDLIEKIKGVSQNFHIYTFGGLNETNKWLSENNYA